MGSEMCIRDRYENTEFSQSVYLKKTYLIYQSKKFSIENVRVFLKKEEEMLEFLLPQYISEGKSQLVISVGCTGGQHRSVFIANRLYEFLRTQGYAVQLTHRDLQRKNK